MYMAVTVSHLAEALIQSNLQHCGSMSFPGTLRHVARSTESGTTDLVVY